MNTKLIPAADVKVGMLIQADPAGWWPVTSVIAAERGRCWLGCEPEDSIAVLYDLHPGAHVLVGIPDKE